MLRVLPVLLGIAVTVFGLVDCLQSDGEKVRSLPKPVWLFVIVVLPVLGAVAWLVAGRPRARPPGRGGPPGRPSSPDDDPDFLRKLRWEQERRRADGDEPV